MDFNKTINDYENNVKTFSYMIKEGKVPVILTAVHTVEQQKEDGIKYGESYTSAICQYVGNIVNSYYMIKSIDNGVDSNSTNLDEFKEVLNHKINKNNIKLLIDIHGAAADRDFDVEFGTLKNMTIDINTQNTLKDCFNRNGINNIKYNEPFCGGGITKHIFENNDIDIIQIEINHKFRDCNAIEKCKKICDSLIEFIKAYSNYN
ncbi:MAG: hypothetical protein ACM3O4_00365 [Ignavibacteriales bacterium]